MIRTLRIKLILASMVSLLLVLTIIFGTVGILNYRKILTDADSILAILQENDGNFPVGKHPEEESFPADTAPKGNRLSSPELPYETRYFSTFLTGEGTVISVNTGKIAAVDTQTAMDYAQSVFAKGASRGFVGDYRYVMYTSGEEVHIILRPGTDFFPGLFVHKRKRRAYRSAGGAAVADRAFRADREAVFRELRKTKTVYYRCRPRTENPTDHH